MPAVDIFLVNFLEGQFRKEAEIPDRNKLNVTRLTAARFFFYFSTQILKLLIDWLVDDSTHPGNRIPHDDGRTDTYYIRAFNFRTAPHQPSIVVERYTHIEHTSIHLTG